MLHSSSSATTPEAQHQMQRTLLLNVVVGQRAAVLELLASEDEALLVRWGSPAGLLCEGRVLYGKGNHLFTSKHKNKVVF